MGGVEATFCERDQMDDEQGAALNTDREIYRGPSPLEWGDDDGFYADSIHVTETGGIGINCGGHVIVMPLRAWHALAVASHESKSCTSVPESVLVGGNHLATVLIGWLGPDFSYRFTPYMDADAAREKIIEAYGTNAYDVWCCWRAIMLARDVHKPGGELDEDRAALARGEIPAHIANPAAPAHFCLAKGCTRKVRAGQWCWQHADMERVLMKHTHSFERDLEGRLVCRCGAVPAEPHSEGHGNG